MTSAAARETVDCHRHGLLIRANNDHVMRVVRHGGCNRTFALEAKPTDESHGYAACPFVTFDQRDLCQVASCVHFDLPILGSNVKG